MKSGVGVYICSVEEDLRWAERVRRDLSEAGFRPWLAGEEIRPGERREASVRRAIRKSRYFLALLSSHSVSKRGAVQKEMKYALDILDEFPDDCVYILPIRLDDCKPSYEKLRRLQWIDFFPAYDTGFRRLLRSIRPEDAACAQPPPPFHHDLFISFAPADNQTAFEAQKGWVSFFAKCLEIRLHQITGEPPDIFRHHLSGGDGAAAAIARTALFVPVLSPSYVKTDACLDVLHRFLQSARTGVGVRINDMPRIFKAVKTHVPSEKEPPSMGDFPRYEFYRFDPETGRHVEFVTGFGREIDREFWERLDDLAHDMLRPLEVVRSGAFPGLPAKPSGVRVYLAETASDVRWVRNALRRELLDRGHTVLPENALPMTGENLEEEIQKNLEQCVSSIHLIGQAYGIVPEERDLSIVELQHHLATEHQIRTPDFSRLVWLPMDPEPKNARQRAFIRDLLDHPIRQPGDDLLQTTVEELKLVVISKLEKSPENRRPEPSVPNLVYLIFDRGDQKDAGPIRRFLNDRNFRVLTPLFDGDETEIRKAHQENLRISNGIIVYRGVAGDAWFKGMLRGLRRAGGEAGTVRKTAVAVYLAGPETDEKSGFQMPGAIILRNFDTFSPRDLNPFLNKLASGGEVL